MWVCVCVFFFFFVFIFVFVFVQQSISVSTAVREFLCWAHFKADEYFSFCVLTRANVRSRRRRRHHHHRRHHRHRLMCIIPFQSCWFIYMYIRNTHIIQVATHNSTISFILFRSFRFLRTVILTNYETYYMKLSNHVPSIYSQRISFVCCRCYHAPLFFIHMLYIMHNV